MEKFELEVSYLKGFILSSTDAFVLKPKVPPNSPK